MKLPEQGVLRLSCLSSIANTSCTFRGAIERPDGRVDLITQSVRAATAGTTATFDIPFAGGTLLYLTATGPGTNDPIGATLATAQVRASSGTAGIAVATVLRGGVGQNTILHYPQVDSVNEVNQGPFGITVQVTDPAAGANWSWDPSLWVVQDLMWIRGQFVTDATVATRVHGLQLVLSAGTGLQYHTGMSQAASLTRQIHWARYGVAPTAVSTRLHGFLPDDFFAGNCTVDSLTEAIQAGDQWSNVVIAFRGWLR